MSDANSIQDIIRKLHHCCSETTANSLKDEFNGLNGKSYLFATDLDFWTQALADRPEHPLYVAAANEYILALLNNAQGQYRNAFKGLRLTLELLLQGIHLSTDLIKLHEWLTSDADTSWAAIVDNENGVFGNRLCRAFFPASIDHASIFRTLAATLYREMSECTHGNVPNKIPLPKTIAFDQPTFELWHDKAVTLRYVANFALTTRYYSSLSHAMKEKGHPIVLDQLSHIEPIRSKIEAEMT